MGTTMTTLMRVRRAVFGPPKDVKDPHAFHKLSLVALLAWVGLGADGLSSSAYGPDEAFRALGEHTGLAVFLALATALTVFIIRYGYSRLIEHVPSGGGGYLVRSAGGGSIDRSTQRVRALLHVPGGVDRFVKTHQQSVLRLEGGGGGG